MVFLLLKLQLFSMTHYPLLNQILTTPYLNADF